MISVLTADHIVAGSCLVIIVVQLAEGCILMISLTPLIPIGSLLLQVCLKLSQHGLLLLKFIVGTVPGNGLTHSAKETEQVFVMFRNLIGRNLLPGCFQLIVICLLHG